MIVISISLQPGIILPMFQVPSYKIAFQVLEELKTNNPLDSFVIISTSKYKNIRSYTCFEWQFKTILSMI